MHLVDDDQPGPGADERHDLVGELGVGEPLGRHEQQVDLVGAQRSSSSLDRGGMALLIVLQRNPSRGPPRSGCASARAAGRSAASARRPLAQEMRGQEVDRALAPPGALHHEHPRPIVDQRLDRLALPVTELGVGSTGQRAQRFEEWVGHAGTVRRGCDEGARRLRISAAWPARRGLSAAAPQVQRLRVSIAHTARIRPVTYRVTAITAAVMR